MPRRTLSRLLILFVVLGAALPAVAVPKKKLKLKGDVYAAALDSANGPMILYWVFNDGRFNEYLEATTTGDVQLLASSSYKKLPSDKHGFVGKYSLSLTAPTTAESVAFTGSARAAQPRERGVSSHMVENQESYDVYYTDSTLQVLDSVDFAAIETEEQYEAEVLPQLGYLYNVDVNAWGGCCDLCWSVHENLNGWRRNGIGNIDFHRLDKYCCLGTCNWFR